MFNYKACFATILSSILYVHLPVTPAVPYLSTRLAGCLVGPGISCGARKLARTPQVIKNKIQEKNPKTLRFFFMKINIIFNLIIELCRNFISTFYELNSVCGWPAIIKIETMAEFDSKDVVSKFSLLFYLLNYQVH